MKPSQIANELSLIDASPSKARGQNFLIDDYVAERQIAAAKIQPTDTVLEIGPGLGMLTHRLAAKADKVIAIETDRKLAGYLAQRLPANVELITADALTVDFPPFDVMVSNLPYSISSPIIFKLLTYNFRNAVVMLQKEFAERMVAHPGSKDYSRLTVTTYYHADCRIIEDVPSAKFYPAPKVDSAVVEIVPRSTPFSISNEKFFFKITELLFQQRRKKIRTILKSKRLIDADYDLPYLDLRVEVLSPEQIGELSEAVWSLKNR
ncbi:16S rRNA (adenine(1518)-N(6)/adenine(1519)-N(6))-dimethyltransferase RsmA [Candidatus Methanomassiliicoccus intestinalis]|uniref:16S rRNA (adenine(1518)-N(6)/adenine(1519)-N(6))- dimethyltransferase RsmA n=2 Tax=Candidatus Methanomassiliicoccus intestinalis TaxID=1406512 RepID=UPI0037DD6838